MFRQKIKAIIGIFCILSLVLALIAPTSVLADGPTDMDKDTSVKPKIELDKGNWLIISYSDKVKDKVAAAQQLDSYLADMLTKMRIDSAIKDEEMLKSGSVSMGDWEQKDCGNSYVSSTFSTYCNWSSSPADFCGNSSSAWYGTSPSSTCNIYLQHRLEGDWPYNAISHVPNGWVYSYDKCNSQDLYVVYNTWYLGSAWSDVKANYTAYSIMQQQDECWFEFEGEDPDLWPFDSLWFGE